MRRVRRLKSAVGQLQCYVRGVSEGVPPAEGTANAKALRRHQARGASEKKEASAPARPLFFGP